MFNLKNGDGQKKFKYLTLTPGLLSSVFDTGDVDSSTEKFLKRLNKCLHICFRKIRNAKQKTNTLGEKLFEKCRTLKVKDDKESIKKLAFVEDMLVICVLRKT